MPSRLKCEWSIRSPKVVPWAIKYLGCNSGKCRLFFQNFQDEYGKIIMLLLSFSVLLYSFQNAF